MIMTIYASQTWGIYETNFFLPAHLIPGVNSFLFTCLFLSDCFSCVCMFYVLPTHSIGKYFPGCLNVLSRCSMIQSVSYQV